MKKFLFSIFAVAMAMTASAQTVTAEFDGANKVVVNYTAGDTEMSAFSLYMKAEGTTIKGTTYKDTPWAAVVDDMENSIFSADPYSQTSNYKEAGFGVFNCKSNPITTVPNGKLVNVVLADNPASGTLTIAPVFSTKDSKSVKVDPFVVQLGGTDGIKNVNTTSVLNGKFVENGSVVIVKNGKKFNAAGAQMK